MIISFSCLVVMNKWQEENLKTLSDLQKYQVEQQQKVMNRLVTLLGTKDPLAYQAIMGAEQSLEAYNMVPASDEAEAERYARMMTEGGFIGYDYNGPT